MHSPFSATWNEFLIELSFDSLPSVQNFSFSSSRIGNKFSRCHYYFGPLFGDTSSITHKLISGTPAGDKASWWSAKLVNMILSCCFFSLTSSYQLNFRLSLKTSCGKFYTKCTRVFSDTWFRHSCVNFSSYFTSYFVCSVFSSLLQSISSFSRLFRVSSANSNLMDWKIPNVCETKGIYMEMSP